MSDTPAEAAEVPAEVEAMDGIESSDEKHNAERPARASGVGKHKKPANSKPSVTTLEVGSSVKGTVKSIATYGAFVDIGCDTDGLLHVSRMSDDFVSDPNDVVSVGDEIDVRIASINEEKKQVALTMQSVEHEEAKSAELSSRRESRKNRPQRSGGDQAAQQATLAKLAETGFDDSKFIEGEVASTLDFGAFVRFDTSQLGEGFEGEIDGLVHISALTEGRADSVADYAKVGDKVQIRVRSVDAQAGRVSLSMITKEAEAAAAAPRESDQGPPRRQSREMFTASELGADDWQEQLEAISQPTFSNRPLVIR